MKKQEDVCLCMSNQGLFIYNRQLSGVVAGLLFLLFCTFMTGYFLGKKYGVEQFMQDTHTQSLQDATTVSTLLNTKNSDASDHSHNATTGEKNVHIAATVDQNIESQLSLASLNQDMSQSPQNNKKYYAQLIGFGTEKAAEQFVKKVASNGIVTEIKKRVSKTVKGHTSYWYQVVTPAYSNKDELSVVVSQLVKTEKLKDVSIQAC